MLQIGDLVRVTVKTEGPDIAEHLASFRYLLRGAEGVVAHITPQIRRPVVVMFADHLLPGAARFWECDLVPSDKGS